MAKKWSRTYWSDLGERVAASALGGVLAMVTADSTGAVSGSAAQWWLVVGVPAAVSLLKGLLANLADPESGPSLLPAPPAPDVKHVRDERGSLMLNPHRGPSRDRTIPGKRRTRARRRRNRSDQGGASS